jgi:hypothetical protein
MNRVEETASMPSMSARASTTRAQVARIAEEDIRQMAAELERWGTQVDELVATTVAPGVGARIDFHEGVDDVRTKDVRTKYEIARARFDELKNVQVQHRACLERPRGCLREMGELARLKGECHDQSHRS